MDGRGSTRGSGIGKSGAVRRLVARGSLRRVAEAIPLAAACLAFVPAMAHADSGSATWTTYLYEGPGWHYSVMTEVFQGQRFDVIGCTKDWCKISYEENTGFVPAEVVVKGTESPLDPPKGVLAQPAVGLVADPKGPCFPANQKGGNGGNAMTWFCQK